MPEEVYKTYDDALLLAQLYVVRLDVVVRHARLLKCRHAFACVHTFQRHHDF